jgi:hypothetical protein
MLALADAQEHMKATVVTLLCLVALASPRAEARKPLKAPKAPPTLTVDQQTVVAEIVSQTFPRPSREAATLALWLDVQLAPALDEDAAPPPPPRRGKRKRKPPPEPALPLFIIRGAPADLVEHLGRPWRVVASALSCRLDPRQPFALNDAPHTPAQLVTLHLAPDVASGTIKIDWTNVADSDPGATNSRDCSATPGPRGWTVHCGGTWFQ